ncbi:MAG: hypothetical protein DHS20C10_00890 [marine bacterium B5-7]|nr:MAG: hypothetical protein DHS20C10_00890 [marine bacterium B5-7]
MKLFKTILLATCLTSTTAFATPKVSNPQPLIMAYWSNWNVYSNDKSGRAIPEADYGLPGSMDNKGVVRNDDVQAKLEKINALTYDFFEVDNMGRVHFSDNWSDLRNDKNFKHNDIFFGNGGLCSNTNTAPICWSYTPGDTTFKPRKNVPADQWNHPKGNFQAFLDLNNTKGNLQKFISIGGYGHDDDFHRAFTHLNNFVSSIVALVNASGIDGIDLDFEPPAGTITTDDANNYANLISRLRQALPNIIISMPIPANAGWVATVGNNWKSISADVNYISLMAYDFHGGFDVNGKTGFNNSLYADPNSSYGEKEFSVEKAVKALEAQGIPANKILAGIPAYGRTLTGVPAGDQHGLYQSFNGIARGDLDEPQCTMTPGGSCMGGFQYSYIVNHMLGQGFTAYQMKDAQHDGIVNAVWAYNPAAWVPPGSSAQYSQVYISYADADYAKALAQYVKTNDLGGVIMWELRGDVAPSDTQHSLLDALNG